jgi:hypothetical protein
MTNLQAFCIHGHFYQPPREDPITGEVPDESGAEPFRNWNERIHAHCYRPNAELGNFGRISFDFGPTLLNWMSSYDPITLAKIVSQERWHYRQRGVGNGLAQPYFHVILPLLPWYDRKTQILWGLRAFEHRFGHSASGLWLPETAVDEDTLALCAELGVRFTILAPWQAAEPDLDVTQPYWWEGSNQHLALFFYHPDLSTRVSFDPESTSNADRFRAMVMEAAATNGDGHAKLILIASDGEVYGHHHPFRDHFLAHLTETKDDSPKNTYLGEWLREHPPQRKMAIRPATSWSCGHDLARWSRGCDCTPQSAWKAPFWEALHRLGEQLDGLYGQVVGRYLNQPWALVWHYIDVLLGRISLSELFFRLSGEIPKERVLHQVDYLLRAQLNKQRMYTSCGWFFEDFGRPEPQINVRYAAQAVWWNTLATGVDLFSETMNALAEVRSNVIALNAAEVFSAHYAYTAQAPFPLVASYRPARSATVGLTNR